MAFVVASAIIILTLVHVIRSYRAMVTAENTFFKGDGHGH